MNRRLRQLLTSFIVACGIAVTMPFQMLTAFAGSAKISFSDPSASVGQEFNVSVKITASEGDLGSADVMLSYDPSYIEFVSGNNANGGAGSVRLVGSMDSDTTTVFSYNLKFKALQAGDSAISVASYEVYDKDTQTVEVTKVGSSSVKVAAPSSYSSEAGLSSLKVSPGTLNPAFSSDVTSYSVNVGADVSKIAVSASAKDDKAKVLVSGNSNLQMGANTVTCKVTAEDGQTVKSYQITVNKSDSAEAAAEPAATQGAVLGELKAEIDGTEYDVASSFDPAALPEGYTQGSCTFNGSEIMAGTGNGVTLIYLQSADGNGGFYIYSEESGALSPYVTIDVAAKSITVLPVDDTVTVPSGFSETTIQLNGSYKVKGWVWTSDEEQRYCVVYGMNENGDKGLYRYDIAEKTFQRYFEDPAVPNKYDDAEVEHLLEQYQSLYKDYNIRFIVMIVLIVICLILFFTVINLLMRRRDTPPPYSGGDRDRRQEAPTPVKRRAMEQEANLRKSRQTPRSDYDDDYRGGRTARDSREDLTRGGRDGRIVRDTADGRDGRALRDTSDGRYDRAGRDAMDGCDGRALRGAADSRVDRTVRGGDSGRTLDVYETRRSERRDYKVLHENSYEEDRQEYIRQRELEREERARQARARLERERREDERRRNGGDDDFEFMDLD